MLELDSNTLSNTLSNSEASRRGLAMSIEITEGPIRLIDRKALGFVPNAPGLQQVLKRKVRLLGDVAEQLLVHYLPEQKRSIPCVTQNCPGCNAMAPVDELRFIPVLMAERQHGQPIVRRWVLQLYPKPWAALDGHELPGLAVHISPGARNQLRLEPLTQDRRAPSELPEAHDVRPTLLKLWKLAAWPFVERSNDILSFEQRRRAMGG